MLTAELVFTIYMLANEKHKATFMAPVGIGLALFVAELIGVYYTGGSLNPARSFGPCVISGVWDEEHWIYCELPLLVLLRLRELISYRGRSMRRSLSCLGVLSLHQNARIRDGESRTSRREQSRGCRRGCRGNSQEGDGVAGR